MKNVIKQLFLLFILTVFSQTVVKGQVKYTGYVVGYTYLKSFVTDTNTSIVTIQIYDNYLIRRRDTVSIKFKCNKCIKWVFKPSIKISDTVIVDNDKSELKIWSDSSIILCNSILSFSFMKEAYQEKYLTVSFKLGKERLSTLRRLNAIPDVSTSGFCFIDFSF